MTAPRPAPDVARLVQLSCQRLFVVQTQFADSFNRMLDELAPSMQLLPPGRGPALTSGLAHCVLWSALTQDPPDVVEATVQRVGADNHSQGFPDDAYSGIGHALLRGIRATLPVGWSSELSSAWVAYYLWLDAHLRAGAELARAAALAPVAELPGQLGAAAPAGTGLVQPPPGTAPRVAQSLDEILELLRATYFADNERALRSVCTRVMLRTGADLRAPRPEQRTDPVVIAQVLESLLLMGFTPSPLPPSPIPAVGSPASAEPPAPRYSAEPAPPPRRRWGLHRRRRDTRGQWPPAAEVDHVNRDRR